MRLQLSPLVINFILKKISLTIKSYCTIPKLIRTSFFSWLFLAVLLGMLVTSSTLVQASESSKLVIDSSSFNTKLLNLTKNNFNIIDESDTSAPVSNLHLTITDGGISVMPGETIPYTLTYTNSDNISINNVVILETVPANTTFNAATSTKEWNCLGGSIEGTLCLLSLNTLPPGSSGTVIFALNVNKPYTGGFNPVTNTATIIGIGQNGNIGDTARDITPVNILSDTPVSAPGVAVDNTVYPYILKKVAPDVAVAGQAVVFTLIVSNPDTKPAENIVVDDPIPAIFRVTGTTTSQGAYTIDGQHLTVNIGTLAPGTTVTILINTVVVEGAEGAQINTATIKGFKEDKTFDGLANGSIPSLRATASIQIMPSMPNTGKAQQISNDGEKLATQHSIRPESSDYEMFGKNISTRHYLSELGLESLHTAKGPIMPTRIRIPILSIDSYIQPVGLLSNGQMDVPDNIWEVGWLNSSALPGTAGNTVLAGHKDSQQGTAVFWALDTLHKGNLIYISDKSGNELTFEVETVELYSLANAPLSRIFGSTSRAQLTLISCAGDFIPTLHTYNQRVVVYAKLLTSDGK